MVDPCKEGGVQASTISDELPQVSNLVLIDDENYHSTASAAKGSGSALFRNKTVYTGLFQNNLMHGQGQLKWADGVAYEGDIVNNALTGEGVYSWPNGSIYKGSVLNGLRHGFGIQKHIVNRVGVVHDHAPRCEQSGVDDESFDVVYEGEWFQGRRHGRGKMIHKGGESQYDGAWVNGRREGFGVMTYPSGNTYSGEWKADLKEGMGTMRWKEEEYTGQWSKDRPHGNGQHVWYDIAGLDVVEKSRARAQDKRVMSAAVMTHLQRRNRYIGEYKFGRPHGRGTFYYANGKKYSGQWKEGLKHGHGRMEYENGFVHDGEFVEDMEVNRPPESMSVGQFRMELDDIIGEQEQADVFNEAEKVGHVLLRNNNALRQVYYFYSSVNSESCEALICMDNRQFWTICKDSGIRNITFSQAQLNRILRHRELTDSQFNSRADIHCPDDLVLMREFCEFLIRLAFIRYPEAESISKALCQMLDRDLFAGFSKNKRLHASGRHPQNASPLKKPDVADTLSTYGKSLRGLYNSYAVHRATNDISLPAKNLLKILKDKGCINEFLNTREVATCISSASSWKPAAIKAVNVLEMLDDELLFEEFEEVLARCSEIRGTAMKKADEAAARRAEESQAEETEDQEETTEAENREAIPVVEANKIPSKLHPLEDLLNKLLEIEGSVFQVVLFYNGRSVPLKEREAGEFGPDEDEIKGLQLTNDNVLSVHIRNLLTLKSTTIGPRNAARFIESSEIDVVLEEIEAKSEPEEEETEQAKEQTEEEDAQEQEPPSPPPPFLRCIRLRESLQTGLS